MDARDPKNLPPVITVDELAAFLRIHRKTVYVAVREGAIAGARRIGRVIRIDRDAALAWLKEGDDTLSDGNPFLKRRDPAAAERGRGAGA